MAYAFQDLKNLLGTQPQQTPDQTNIFGSGGPSAETLQAQGSQGAPKTDASGDIGAAGSAGSPDPAARNSQVLGGPSDMSAYSVNSSKVSAPPAAQNALGKIKKASDALQLEANNYITGQTAKNTYGVDNDTLKLAIDGDSAARGKVTGTLGRTDINPLEDFYATTDTSLDDVEALLGWDAGMGDEGSAGAKNAGLSYLLAKNSGPTYTQGMSEFDAAMLGQNSRFQNLLNELGGSYRSLQEKAGKIGGESKKAAEGHVAKNLSMAQDYLKTRLSAEQKAILDAEAKAVAAANKQRAGSTISIGAEQEVKKAFERQKEKVRQALEAIRPGAGSLVNGISRQNVSSPEIQALFKMSPEYAAADLITAAQAGRYNSISGLLGSTDMQAAGRGRGKDYAFDEAGLYNLLLGSGEKKLATRDTNDKASIERLLGILNDSATKENTRRSERAKSAAEEIAEIKAKLAREAAKTPHLADYYNDPNNLVDMSKYITFQKADLKGEDRMTERDAAKLNAIAKRLGLPETYKASTRKDGSAYSFDRDRYLADLTMAVNANRQKVEEQKAQEEEKQRQEEEERQRRSHPKPGTLVIPTGDEEEEIIQAGQPEGPPAQVVPGQEIGPITPGTLQIPGMGGGDWGDQGFPTSPPPVEQTYQPIDQEPPPYGFDELNNLFSYTYGGYT